MYEMLEGAHGARRQGSLGRGDREKVAVTRYEQRRRRMQRACELKDDATRSATRLASTMHLVAAGDIAWLDSTLVERLRCKPGASRVRIGATSDEKQRNRGQRLREQAEEHHQHQTSKQKMSKQLGATS